VTTNKAAIMSFSLNEDQTLLKDAADGFFADNAPVTAWRKLRDAKETYDPALWQEIGAMGFAGAMIGEDHGGSAMGLRAMSLVLEAQASTMGASPLLQTGLVCANAIMLLGDASQKDYCLPKIATGEVSCAFAIDEGAHHRPDHIQTTATKTEGGWLVTGSKAFVPDGTGADWLFVVAKLEDGLGDALGVFVIDRQAKGVTRTPRASVDGRDFADIAFDATFVADFMLLNQGPVDAAALEKLLDMARLGICAEMLGLTKAAFDMTLDYLKTRTQFGQVIGGFQALQHRAAAMLVEMELTRSCVLDAIVQVEAGKSVPEAVSLAKARAGDTMHLVTNEMIQMHGGIGMTDAHDSGFYIKRARVLETLYGSAAFHRDRWAKLHDY
jgi:alkylation response protein AidB-like acyl-CoA dehydrogenase